MGKTFNVKIIIQEFSEPGDREILLEAFKKAGNKGVFNAVEKDAFEGTFVHARHGRLRHQLCQRDFFRIGTDNPSGYESSDFRLVRSGRAAVR